MQAWLNKGKKLLYIIYMLGALQTFFVSFLRKLGFLNKEATLVLIGLDNAGKTTLQCRLQSGKLKSFAPTVRANSEDFTVGGVKFKAWDLGGHTSARHLWTTFCLQAHGIIFMLDSADRDRFGEAHQELTSIALSTAHTIPLLILANKCELEFSVTRDEIYSKLNLSELSVRAQRPIELFMISCVKGQGYEEGFRWLSQFI